MRLRAIGPLSESDPNDRGPEDAAETRGKAQATTGGTPLERFLRQNGIRPAHLAVACGYSRQHLLRIRKAEMEPTRRCIAAILGGVRLLTRVPVTVLDLFDFEDGPIAPARSDRRHWKATLLRKGHGGD